MALALIVARLLLATVFVVASLTKLADLAGSQQVGTRRSPSSGIRAMAFRTVYGVRLFYMLLISITS